MDCRGSGRVHPESERASVMQLSVRAVAGQIVTAFIVTPVRIRAENLLFTGGINSTAAVVVLMCLLCS